MGLAEDPVAVVCPPVGPNHLPNSVWIAVLQPSDVAGAIWEFKRLLHTGLEFACVVGESRLPHLLHQLLFTAALGCLFLQPLNLRFSPLLLLAQFPDVAAQKDHQQ